MRKATKNTKVQQTLWQQQVKQVGDFSNTEMYFICQCMRFKTFECDRIIKSFKTVGDLCQATQKELNAINSRLVDILTMLGCIPKPEQDIQCDVFEQMLASLADPPLLDKESWYRYYLDQAFQGKNYEHFFHKHGSDVYILKSEGLAFLSTLNSWSYKAIYELWGIVSAKKADLRSQLIRQRKRRFVVFAGSSARTYRCSAEHHALCFIAGCFCLLFWIFCGIIYEILNCDENLVSASR